MKLAELKYEDRFSVNGKKWSQFLRVKKPTRKIFNISCMAWPMCEEVKSFKSNTEVKLIIKGVSDG